MELGVCYYPEQWPEAWWADDARRMAEMGIRWVRIAEFAWSRIEPAAGQWDWGWLDRAIETLHGHGLKVVLCTPTATPPRWLLDAEPGMLAVDAQGQSRGFGSRRHYCFSSTAYRQQSERITRAMASRYGQHPAVAAWQTDNEYGCHLTVLSYSADARAGFRDWLRARYGDVATLNTAWGTVFWSQEYSDFAQIDPPVATVTEANPAHRLDYRRFASDAVRSFNRAQVDLLRSLSPGRPVTHNFMGFFTEFDHHDVSEDLDIASWDSYPLGFTQDFFLSDAEKLRYARTGHPDIPSFHHDLYRGMCKGRWWVMEQQPGPVNWARWNTVPLDGMVRLWTWQAFAHGAEVVSYFRWRQAPFAQEQMHAGLNRPDRSVDQGGVEAAQVALELQQFPHAAAVVQARVALVFDYRSQWMAQIQPQGADFNALELTFRAYSALRQLGLDVDIVAPRADLTGYALVVLPAQLQEDADWMTRAARSGAQVVFGPRAGSKTADFAIPDGLAPGAFAGATGLRVQRVGSLPPGWTEAVLWDGGGQSMVSHWREDLHLQGAIAVAAYTDGRPAVARHGHNWYCAGWPDAVGWQLLLLRAAAAAGLPTQSLPVDVRVSQAGGYWFVQNFSNAVVELAAPPGAHCVVGARATPPQGVSVWQLPAHDRMA